MKSGTPEEYRAYQRAMYAKHAAKRRAARRARYSANLTEERRSALERMRSAAPLRNEASRLKRACRLDPRWATWAASL